MGAVSPFILCGGAGTRLWPLSREAFPKQFHRIASPETLFQQACRRLSGDLFGSLSVLSNQMHRFLIADQLQEIGIEAANIVLEPVMRNTAPAACIAALIAARDDPESLVLLAPSDHMVTDASLFAKSVEGGIDAAKHGALVTFGVEPDCPHTGYGYIEIEKANSPDLPVKRFVEKPSQEVAEAYLASGSFLWNAGLFLFRSATMLELMQANAPEILLACRAALDGAVEDLDFLRLGADYAKAPAISLDYAIAEKADRIRCVPLAAAWSDVGSWSAIWTLMPKDGAGNVVHGEGEVLLADTAGSPWLRRSRRRGERHCGSDRGCRARRLQGPSRVRESHCRAAQGQPPSARVLSQPCLPALGLVSDHQSGRPLSGQMHHGKAWRDAVAAKPLPPLRALGGGQGHARSHQGRGGRAAQRERVHLYPHR